MRVPEETGLGVAKVRLSFDAWKTGHVVPATLEVALIEAKPKPKTAEQPRPEPKVTDSKELRKTLRHDGYISGLAFSPDGRLLATLDWDRQGGESTIHLWDAATGKSKAVFDLKPKRREVFSLRIDPTSKLLAIATREVKLSEDGKRYESWLGWNVRVLDITSGKEKVAFAEKKPGSASVLTFDSNSLLLAIQEGEPWKQSLRPYRVMRLDLANGAKSTIYESKERGCGISTISPDRRFALLVLEPSAKAVATEVQLLDLKTGHARPLWETHDAVATAGAFSSDGKTAAVFLRNKLRFWDVPSAKEQTEQSQRYAAFWKRPQNERLSRIVALQYSPDDKLLAVAHETLDIPSHRNITEIVLWNPATGEARATLRGHTHLVFKMEFAPDGRTLATGGFDKMVKLWDLSVIGNDGSRENIGK